MPTIGLRAPPADSPGGGDGGAVRDRGPSEPGTRPTPPEPGGADEAEGTPPRKRPRPSGGDGGADDPASRASNPRAATSRSKEEAEEEAGGADEDPAEGTAGRGGDDGRAASSDVDRDEEQRLSGILDDWFSGTGAAIDEDAGEVVSDYKVYAAKVGVRPSLLAERIVERTAMGRRRAGEGRGASKLREGGASISGRKVEEVGEEDAAESGPSTKAGTSEASVGGGVKDDAPVQDIMARLSSLEQNEVPLRDIMARLGSLEQNNLSMRGIVARLGSLEQKNVSVRGIMARLSSLEQNNVPLEETMARLSSLERSLAQIQALFQPGVLGRGRSPETQRTAPYSENVTQDGRGDMKAPLDSRRPGVVQQTEKGPKHKTRPLPHFVGISASSERRPTQSFESMGAQGARTQLPAGAPPDGLLQPPAGSLEQSEQHSEREDRRPATLSRNPQTLEALWVEYKLGVDGRKPAALFTPKERATTGMYKLRNVIWRCIDYLVCRGCTSQQAIESIRRVYGHNTSITPLAEMIRRDKKRYPRALYNPDLFEQHSL